MKIKYCIMALLLPLLFRSNALNAQTISIPGQVTDARTGIPLSGATLMLRSSGVAVISNNEGRFTLQLTLPVDSLTVTCIGYAPRHLLLQKGSASLILALEPLINNLAAVTVSTGYQTLPKERATGSFAQVDTALFNSRITTSLLDRLQNISPGLLFNRGTAGRGTELSIRGQSTIFANASPLIVVDNFPFEGDISALNPNDIESVTILKDAAAASIWGVRAGNGVLVITTKKAKTAHPLQVSLTAGFTAGSNPDMYYDSRFIPAAAFMEIESFLFSNGFYNTDFDASRKTPLSPYVSLLHKQELGQLSESELEAQAASLQSQDVRADLSRNFYQRPLGSQYLLSISGAGPKAGWYISAGFDNNRGIAVGSNTNRVTLHNLLQVFPVPALEVSAGLDYNSSKQQTDNTIPQITMGGPAGKNIYPYAALATGDGTPLLIVKDYESGFVAQAASHGFLNWQFNPLQELRNGYNTSESRLNQLRVSASARYSLFRGFSAEIRYQLEKSFTKGSTLAAADSYFARNLVNELAEIDGNGNVTAFTLPSGGIRDQNNAELTAHNGRIQFNYKLHKANHDFTALAGVEWRQVRTQSNSYRLYGYDQLNGSFRQVNPLIYYQLYPSGSYYQLSLNQSLAFATDRFRSAFANLAWSYKERYTLSLSGRRDGSNYFGVAANRKTVPLWSAGIKWDVAKQPFYNISWLPVLSLRLTYGYNGNLNRSITALATASYASNDPYTGLPYLTIINPPNKDLAWEQTAMFNAGFDFACAGNRITGSLEYYHRKGTGIIGDAALAPSTGYIDLNFFTNTAKGNFADMQGHGVDITLSSINIKTPFTWSSQLWVSYATDKVTHFGAKNPLSQLIAYGSGANGFIIPLEGKPVYGIYSLPFAGLSAAGDPQGYSNGTVTTDYALLNNPQSIGEITYNGPARPVWFGALSNTVTYKQFSLIVNIGFKAGYYFRRTGLNYSNLFNYYQQHSDYLLRWQKPGDELHTSVPSMVYPADNGRDRFYTNSSALIERADHIRLQDITISYNLNRSVIKKLPLANIRLYINANNLCIIWRANKLGLDPDYPTGIPPVRLYAFGVKADF